jgi:hypothetical protein
VSDSVKGLLREKLVTGARGQFGNPQEGERPPLEAVTRKRHVGRQQTERTYCVL